MALLGMGTLPPACKAAMDRYGLTLGHLQGKKGPAHPKGHMACCPACGQPGAFWAFPLEPMIPRAGCQDLKTHSMCLRLEAARALPSDQSASRAPLSPPPPKPLPHASSALGAPRDPPLSSP